LSLSGNLNKVAAANSRLRRAGGKVMALIDKKLVTERETASYKFDRATLELVRSYAEFIGSPQEHVVNEALRYLFRKDKDFKKWLGSRDKSDLSAVTETPEISGKRKGPGGGTIPASSKLVGGTDS